MLARVIYIHPIEVIQAGLTFPAEVRRLSHRSVKLLPTCFATMFGITPLAGKLGNSMRNPFFSTSRRQVLISLSAGVATFLFGEQEAAGFTTGQTLPVGEDLMQEHGVFRRLLMIYDELSHRFEQGFADPDGCLSKSTDLIITYVQNHHERIEELMVFPALTKANAQAELVSTLVEQHQVGRDITDAIQKRIESVPKPHSSTQAELSKLTRSYSHMFRAHAAREDTVAFPALRKIMTPTQYQEFSDKVLNIESKMKVAELDDILKKVLLVETALDLADLNKFTAHPS